MVAIAGGIILAILVLAALAAVVIGINLMASKTDEAGGLCLIVVALIVLVPFGCSLMK